MLTPLLKLSLATTARGLFSVTGWPRDRVKTPVCVWCTPWLGSLLPLSKPYIRLGVEREVPPIAHNAGSHDRPSFDTDFSSSCFLQITGLVSFLPPLLHSLLPHTYLRGTPPRNSRAGGLIFFLGHCHWSMTSKHVFLLTVLCFHFFLALILPVSCVFILHLYVPPLVAVEAIRMIM